jgi:structural maintenance of chromosome 4
LTINADRLEEMNDGRQTMVQRLKLVERERDGLEGARAAAEAYMDKERECTNSQCTIYQVEAIPYLIGRVPSFESQAA